MNESLIAAIASRYEGADINKVFTEPRLLIHSEPVEGLGEYQLRISKPLKGVGLKMPKWRIEISALRPDGTTEVLNDGNALAPWNVMGSIVSEALKVMAICIEQGRGSMIKARRQGMRAVR